MNSLTQAVKNFWNDEEGVTAIEYSLIAALIAVVIVVAVQNVGNSVNAVFETVNDKLQPIV